MPTNRVRADTQRRPQAEVVRNDKIDPGEQLWPALFGTVNLTVPNKILEATVGGPGRPSRAAVYRRMEEAVRELSDRLGGLPSPTEAEDIWSDIWHQEAHNSTAIEGNTLVLKEVEKLLEEGRAVGAKPLRDYMEVRGY